MLIAVCALLTALCVVLIVHDLLRVDEPPAVPPVEPRDHTPVSIIVPARNEELRIARLLDGLEHQTSSQFEVLVLDDHSTDRTAALVQARASRIAGLRVIAGEPLPDGWAGKCWACWQGAGLSRGAWLLFLDADTAPMPALVVSLLAHAEARQLDLLSILPLLELGSFWERLLMPPFFALIQTVFPSREVNDPRSHIAMANGPCILIRRDVYFSTGGHAAVRGSVLEDVHLGQQVKSAGYRIELARAPELLRVRMYSGLAEIVEGLRKNAWAGYSAGGWRSAWGGVRQTLLACAPAGLIMVGAGAAVSGRADAGAVVGMGVFLGLLVSGVWAYQIQRRYRLNPVWGLLFPWGTLIYFALTGLAWISIRRGTGVQWKGRAYRG